MSEHRCKIFRGWSSHVCGKRASLNEDGQWWCRTHAPSSVAARAAKREAKRAPHQAALDRRIKRKDARDRIVAAALAWDGIVDTGRLGKLWQAIKHYRKISGKP